MMGQRWGDEPDPNRQPPNRYTTGGLLVLALVLLVATALILAWYLTS